AAAIAMLGELGIPTVRAALTEVLGRATVAAPAASESEIATALERARRFAEIRHPADSRALAALDVYVRLVVDSDTDEALLVLAGRRDNRISLGIANLRDPGPATAPTIRLESRDGPSPDDIESLRNGGTVALLALGIRQSSQ
ncbi:MAG: hypothetical protein V2A73_03395, partial [Pseudomonadota bacterium]